MTDLHITAVPPKQTAAKSKVQSYKGAGSVIGNEQAGGSPLTPRNQVEPYIRPTSNSNLKKSVPPSNTSKKQFPTLARRKLDQENHTTHESTTTMHAHLSPHQQALLSLLLYSQS